MTERSKTLIDWVPPTWRRVAVSAFDVLAVFAAWWGSVFIATNFVPPADRAGELWLALLVLAPAEALIFRRMGLYRGIWIFSSLPDLQRIAKAVAISFVLVSVGVGVFRETLGLPLGAALIYPALLLLVMGGGRAIYRTWSESLMTASHDGRQKPLIVIGAGRQAARVVQSLALSAEWRVVGLLDNDPGHLRRAIYGVPVLGPIEELASWKKKLDVGHVVLAVDVPIDQKSMLDRFAAAGVKALTMPALAEMPVAGLPAPPGDALRPLDLNDLIGRAPVTIDFAGVRKLIAGKSVLVTGAGGSIGSELCRQMLHVAPAQLILFENNEYALYEINEELTRLAPEIDVVPLVGDVKDGAWVGDVMRRYSPAVVFHAAAYKHVPLMEDNNAWQAVRNNVLGTYIVAQAAIQADVREFVLVSTDKAINPTNVMGATKRLAEMVCLALQAAQSRTSFEMVRFGNVLGSAGSVIPKFKEQIERGGPVTVTHPEITRYFMSIPEAAQLVLQAAAMGQGGEIFVLDMGAPIRIADLARKMIHLSGYSESEIRIEFIGLRPGEKLYEELLADAEHTRQTPHPKLRIAQGRAVDADFLPNLRPWFAEPCQSDAQVRENLMRWVPEYQPVSFS